MSFGEGGLCKRQERPVGVSGSPSCSFDALDELSFNSFMVLFSFFVFSTRIYLDFYFVRNVRKQPQIKTYKMARMYMHAQTNTW